MYSAVQQANMYKMLQEFKSVSVQSDRFQTESTNQPFIWTSTACIGRKANDGAVPSQNTHAHVQSLCTVCVFKPVNSIKNTLSLMFCATKCIAFDRKYFTQAAPA